MNRFLLYEQCVQSPRHLIPMLRAMHGELPLVLGEDFAGTAAISNLWTQEVEGGRAVAVDLDQEALDFHGEQAGVTKHCLNVLQADEPVDLIFVGNFSIGYWHTRAELLAYLRHVRTRLERSRGVFVCDTYGGETAYTLGDVHRDHWITEGELAGTRVRYTWEQREADPITGMVLNALHFRIEKSGMIEHEIEDAFIYRWRLWSLPELRDAMLDAGFAGVDVFDKAPSAVDGDGNTYMCPVTDGEELESSYIVCVAARV